jgi:hypothetical protein
MLLRVEAFDAETAAAINSRGHDAAFVT